MNLNHDHSSPREENYLNGSIDDFTDCIDFTKQYQKSCGLEENSIDEENYLVEKEETNKTNKSENILQRIKSVEEKPDDSFKKTENLEEEEDKNSVKVEEKININKNEEKIEIENENHPMEPDVSITVGESNLDKTINDVASGIEEKSTEIKLVEDSKKKLVKQKFKKNHLKLPVNKNNKKKSSLFKLKDSKFIKKRNKSLQYQGIQSNIKFKCYKCSYSDFSTITELQAHQRKCLSETLDFQSVGDPGTSFTNPSSSNLRITRKVYLCSACGSYYENWNLFLHMKEIHKRHICLYCLGMFSQPDKLAQHLQTKHNVVEQNLSSVEEFSKLYRGSCYLVCVSCEAMFSEQEDFYEHSCASSQTEDTGACPFCGLRGAHFPTCRRAFSDRSVEADPEKSHPGLGKKLSSKKKKVKANKKLKEVFRIVNNEHNGEMSVIVRKQSVGENTDTGNDSRSKDSCFLGNNEKTMGSPLRNSNEDLVSVKQYNEKMLQLYRPNKPPEKVISSIQSIEDSINRVVENSRVSDEDEKEIEEEEEEDDINFDSRKEYPSNYENAVTCVTDNPTNYQRKEAESPCIAENFEEKALVPEIAPLNLVNGGNAALKNEEPSDSESTDSEKLTIAFDQPSEHSSGKTEADEKKPEITTESVCEKSEDNIPTAPSDTSYISVSLKGEGADLSLKSLIREFVKVSCWNCVYCSHAKRIAVNGKQLVLHVLAEHRFVTVPEDSSEEAKEESAVSVIQKLKSELSCLENCYFNSDTFDSEDKEFWKANDRIYECFHCLFATYVHKELYSHNRKMHQKTVFLCIMCKSNFYNYSELLCHLCPGIYIAGQVINPDITYRCFLCNVDPLPSSFRLMVHLRRRHNSCDICFDQSSNQFQLSTHVWKHKLSHMCYRCGIAYRNKPDITKHLFWKHGTESVLCKKCLQKKWPHVYHFCVPPNSFICDECSVSLKSAVALKVHKRLHSGDYPYSCTKCDEKFISRKLLVKHLDKHEEENKPLEVETTEPESEKTICNLEETKSSEGEVNDSEEAEKKIEKERKPKKRKVLTDVFDLPPVNLSESDDSDQEESEAKRKAVKPESPVEEPQMLNGYLNGDLQKEEPSPTQIVDGVWNNFQNYLVAKDMPKTFRPSSPFKNMTLDKIKEIMLSDHDYYIIPNSTSQEETPSKTEPESTTEKKAGLDHDYCNNVSKCKSKSKQKAKHREDESKSSSSDSSSDSDSSCSCGSNCSCTSGSSSSTSSNDSDSDSREKRKQKKSPRETKIVNEVEPETPAEVDIFVHDVPNENLIRESDLETDETETDEDFYDYNPAREANRILFEKRTQLLANLNGSDAVVSSPPVPAKKPQNPKKKSKLKKKRSQSRVTPSRGNRKKNTNAGAVTFTSKTSITPFIPETKLDTNSRMFETPVNLAYSQLRMEDSVQNSAEGDLKRPKRKRVPLKFYGFSSDDESETTQGLRKREKVVEHTSTTPATTENTLETTPTIWNPHSKNSLSWRVEKSEVSTTPKVNPIKIRTSQTARHNPVLENASSSEIFQIKRPTFQVNGNPTGQKGEKLYCFCQCPYDEVSEMIACDAEDCVIEWFHFECVGIMVPPKGSWYCPDCRKKFAAENEFLSSPANDQIIN